MLSIVLKTRQDKMKCKVPSFEIKEEGKGIMFVSIFVTP